MVDLDERRQLLESAGLTVLDDAWSSPAPAPMEAWRPIISGAATPAATVQRDETGEYLATADRQWESLSAFVGVIGPDGDFLISVAGEGASTAPWAHVRHTGVISLSSRLGQVPGEPEFVTMAVDGTAVCGVTTEEYEVWIVTASLTV